MGDINICKGCRKKIGVFGGAWRYEKDNSVVYFCDRCRPCLREQKEVRNNDCGCKCNGEFYDGTGLTHMGMLGF